MVGILNTFCLFQGDTRIRKFNSENKIKILKLIQAYHVETPEKDFSFIEAFS